MSPMIYAERVDFHRLEIYDTKPYLRLRNLITGRWVSLPDRIGVVKICGGETGGGKEPIEIEGIEENNINLYDLLDEYFENPDGLKYFFEYELQEIMEERILDNIAYMLGSWFLEIIECKGRELRVEPYPEEKIIIRWRHKKRWGWERWREEEIPTSPIP